MIQTGETKSGNKYRVEKRIHWHFEHPEACAPVCKVMNGLPGATHHPAKYMTDKWEYVTCPKCLAMKPKENEDEDEEEKSSGKT